MSDVLRVIGAILLALICCYIGVLIKKRYKDRVTFYKSAYDFATALSTELAMLKTPMPDIAQKFLQGRKGDFEQMIERWIKSSKNLSEDAFEHIGSLHVLKKDEQSEIKAFLTPLGKSVLNEQLAHINYFKEVFEQKIKKCVDESKKLGNMYFKLCALLGLALVLILA